MKSIQCVIILDRHDSKENIRHADERDPDERKQYVRRRPEAEHNVTG